MTSAASSGTTPPPASAGIDAPSSFLRRQEPRSPCSRRSCEGRNPVAPVPVIPAKAGTPQPLFPSFPPSSVIPVKTGIQSGRQATRGGVRCGARHARRSRRPTPSFPRRRESSVTARSHGGGWCGGVWCRGIPCGCPSPQRKEQPPPHPHEPLHFACELRYGNTRKAHASGRLFARLQHPCDTESLP